MYVRTIKLKNRRIILTRGNDGGYLIILKKLLEKGETREESENRTINGRVQEFFFRISEESAGALYVLLNEELTTNEILKFNQEKERNT